MTEAPFRLYEVAVVAVFDLGGAERSVDTEDIAIRCHEIAGATFAWRKYPDQVNLELVRVCLSDAKKLKNGALLSGTGRDGWRLTRKGLAWMETVAVNRDHPRPAGGRRSGGSIDTVRRDREIRRVEGSAAWADWQVGRRIHVGDARSLFRIDSYSNNQMVEIKLTRLLALFDVGSEHHRFLEAAARVLEEGGDPSA